jgi:hypothetical protein
MDLLTGYGSEDSDANSDPVMGELPSTVTESAAAATTSIPISWEHSNSAPPSRMDNNNVSFTASPNRKRPRTDNDNAVVDAVWNLPPPRIQKDSSGQWKQNYVTPAASNFHCVRRIHAMTHTCTVTHTVPPLVVPIVTALRISNTLGSSVPFQSHRFQDWEYSLIHGST